MHYGTRSAVSIGVLLGKSANAVRLKANKLKLKSSLPHAVKLPLNTVINFRARGMSARKVGRLIGCSHKGVLYAEQHHYIRIRNNE